MRKGRFIVAALILASAAAVYAYWQRNQQETRADYVTETIDRGAIATVVTATGIVNPVTSVQVGTYVSGPIKAIDVDFNSPVERGQRVAKIDPASFEVKVRKAEANLANARAKVEKDRADLALKQLTLKRYQELGERDLVAQNDVDTARSEYDQARAQLTVDQAAVQQSAAELDDAKINLGYTDIRSPVDGVIVSRNVDVGQTVAASFQTPTLFLIAQDLTKMQVDTAVSESDIGNVRMGQAATFTVDAYGSKTFTGTVAQVRNAPTTVLNVVTYDVVVAVDNADLLLKPGMTATVTITTAQQADVLRVPVRALRFHPERAAPGGTASPGATANLRAQPPRVWILDDADTLRSVELQLGLRNEQHAELLKGDLQAGQKVAVGLKREEKAAPDRPALPGQMRFR